MREYRIKISDKSTGRKLLIGYTDLTYMDWALYHEDETRFDPPVFRYIISTYLTHASFIEDSESPSVELSHEDVFNLPVPQQKQIIDHIFKSSMFADTDKFEKVLSNLDEHSKTRMGSYDLFLYTQLGVEGYISLLAQPPEIRAQIIMILEKMTQIDVSKRFEESINNGQPLDLITLGGAYEREQRKKAQMSPQARKDPHISPVKKFNTEGREDLPSDIGEMIASSREALQESIQRSKKGDTKEHFNWQSENQKILNDDRFQDRKILSTKHPSSQE
jgi:hypothetical protein